VAADSGDRDEPFVQLVRWRGPWRDDDRDANFKTEIALYANSDPLRTITNLSNAIGVPAGALVRYVLARWASEGAAGLLELGPTMVKRLNAVCEEAEAVGDDASRLAAYEQLRQMLSWLQYGLDHPEVYEP